MSRLPALWIAPIVGALALPWLGCPDPTPSVRAEGPSVVLYLVDTLRPDHLGVYGYPRETSPRLDAFARDAVVFENAYSPSSWTRPATASLLTGLSPGRHGATGRVDVLPDEVRLLSEHFQEAGYRTLGLVTNPNVIPLWGFDQGFDLFEDVDSRSRGASADVLMDRVLEQLDALPPDTPFFLYVHALDPHEPYEPPPDWAQPFEGGGRRDVALYDGEIAFGDYHFGRLLDRLRARGQYEEALVVFVSDHGEEFEEHGGTGHGHALFEESVRIPLLVKLPGNERAGARVSGIATLMDVAPTVLAALGRPVPADLDGVDLLSDPSATRGERPLFLDLELDWHRGRTDIVRGVRVGDRKYLRRMRPVEGELLFDLASDPGETADLRESSPEEAAELAALLDAHTAAHSTGVHLRVIHSAWGTDRRCRARLETAGRFVQLATRLLEAGDRVELADGGRSLLLDVALRNYPHPTGGVPHVIIDEDAVAVEVEPRDAAIELTALPDDDHGPCDVWLGPDHTALEGSRLRFDTGRADLALRDVSSLVRAEGPRGAAVPQGIYLAVVRPADARSEVPEEVRARLRELGYLE